MECIFDELTHIRAVNPDGFRSDASVRKKLRRLTEYYEGGEWLEDYSLDEQGMLPTGLKRGVLSQDGVYDFLSSIRQSMSDTKGA